MHTRCWNLFSSSRTFRLHIVHSQLSVRYRHVCFCVHAGCTLIVVAQVAGMDRYHRLQHTLLGCMYDLYWGCSLVSRLFRLQIMQASINVGLHSHVHGIVRYACAAFLRVPCTRMIAMCLMGAPVTGSMHIFIPGETMVSRLFRSQNMHTAIKV